MITKKIVLTGSHLTPALALKAKLHQHGWQVIELKIPSPKLNRHRLILASLSLIKLPLSLFSAYQKLSGIKPRLVVSFGGHAAFPVCLAAKLLNLPLIIHEQTFGAGLTSRLTALMADKVAISWPSSQPYFPQKKVVLTGNPIRRELLNLQSNISHLKSIYITGGHQGSRIINTTVAEIIPQLVKKFTVYHQFGLLQSSLAFKKQRQFKHPRYILKRWFGARQLAKILADADLVISRGGVNTITELAYLQLPAVLVPLTSAQKNEQITNAKFLESLGLAIILPQSELNSAHLLQLIDTALRQLPRQTSLAFDRRLIYSATDNLYQLIESVIHETNQH